MDTLLTLLSFVALLSIGLAALCVLADYDED